MPNLDDIPLLKPHLQDQGSSKFSFPVKTSDFFQPFLKEHKKLADS
jgi:hypothetical protein